MNITSTWAICVPFFQGYPNIFCVSKDKRTHTARADGFLCLSACWPACLFLVGPARTNFNVSCTAVALSTGGDVCLISTPSQRCACFIWVPWMRPHVFLKQEIPRAFWWGGISDVFLPSNLDENPEHTCDTPEVQRAVKLVGD